MNVFRMESPSDASASPRWDCKGSNARTRVRGFARSAAASAADDGGDGGGGDGDGGLVKVIGKDHAHVAPLVEMLVLLEGVTLEDGDGG